MEAGDERNLLSYRSRTWYIIVEWLNSPTKVTHCLGLDIEPRGRCNVDSMGLLAMRIGTKPFLTQMWSTYNYGARTTALSSPEFKQKLPAPKEDSVLTNDGWAEMALKIRWQRGGVCPRNLILEIFILRYNHADGQSQHGKERIKRTLQNKSRRSKSVWKERKLMIIPLARKSNILRGV